MQYKMAIQSMTIEDALSNGFGELQSLRDEVREIVDNANDSLSQTARIQTLSETADTLDNVADNEPDLPSEFNLTLSVGQLAHKRKNVSASRSIRRDNAVSCLAAVVAVCDDHLKTFDSEKERSESDQSAYDMVETLRDNIQEVIDEVDELKFPGMFG